MNAVDTNVFVYALDHDELLKQTKAIDLIDRLASAPSESPLLWQVAAEFLSCLRRWEKNGRLSRADVEDDLSDLLAAFPLVLPNRRILKRSIELSSRFSLSHWDSMLLAACVDAGVDTLYSEDLDHGMTYDSVRVLNPFA